MNKVLKLLVIVAGLAAFALPAQAYEKGDWIVRGGVGTVDPESTSYSDSDGVAVKIDSGTAATFTAAYFMSPNWSFEVLAASPFKHDVNLGVDGQFANIGSVKHLPPTFSFQYHFMPDGTFRPYVGLGLNYTTFFSESLIADLDPVTLSVDDSFGVAVQLATDIKLSDKWLLNLDVRWIQIKADATLAEPGFPSETIALDINPIVYSVNLGYMF